MHSQLVIISWFELQDPSSLAPDCERQGCLTRSPHPAGVCVNPTGACTEAPILRVRFKMFPHRGEEEIRPSFHDAEVRAHNYQTSIIACLDPAAIGKRF